MPTRRAVLLSALAASAGASLPAAAPAAAQDSAAPTVLRLQNRTIEVNGKAATVFGIRQPDGTDGIFTEAGKPFRVRVENRIAERSLIHWHGLMPPPDQDGVPGISGPPIPPGGSADYDFPLRFGGTFWMHSHQGLQEQLLMAAPLIIRDARDIPGQRELVVMLADFSFTPPERIYENLRKPGARAGNAGMPGMAGMPMASMPMAAMPGMPHGAAMPMQAMPMQAMPGMAGGAKPDLNDVKYDAFLANDRTLADPEVIGVEPGETVLLRIINSSSMSAYHIELGQLDGTLIAVDGFQVVPVVARRFPITVAQRLDIRVTVPRAPGAHPILAVLEGERARTGIVLRAGKAPVTRIADAAATPSAALTLDLEGRLRAAVPLAPRKADRVHTVDLTGDMAAYVWSINGVAWNKDVPPFPVAKGERVELVMTNRTMMPHPMHLHGHEFQVVEIDGKRFAGAVRDTVLVPPGKRVVVAFDANNPGTWAFHCHLLYHMDAGMFQTVRYV